MSNEQTALGLELERVSEEFRQAVRLFDQRERAELDLRRAANGSFYRRLAADVLEPARLERVVPLSALAASALPDPARLRSSGWLGELYECPADAAALSARTESAVRMPQHAGDELQLLAAATGQSPRELRYFDQVYRPALAAVDSATTGEGKEYVPSVLSGRWLERIGAAAQLTELFQVVPMPAPKTVLPGWAVLPGRAVRHAEETGDSSQTVEFLTPATRAVTLQVAATLAATAIVSVELDKDALAAVAGQVEAELADTLAYTLDSAIVDGDTATTHQDSDVTDDDARKNWDGLRKLTPSGSKTDGSNATLSAAMLRVNRKKLGRAGAVAAELAHIVSPASLGALAADSAFVSVEKYGPLVSPLPGEAGRVDGVPVIVSDLIRADLNATGVYDGTTKTRSVALTVNRKGFLVGQRRGITLTTVAEPWRQFDQTAVRATMRLCLVCREPAGTEPAALTYNLSTA